MKILTTNFVQCPVKSCAKSGKGFPLRYTNVDLVQKRAEFDPEFMLKLLSKLLWEELVIVFEEVSIVFYFYFYFSCLIRI